MAGTTTEPQRIGPFAVLRRLAVGGMAEVFLAVEAGGPYALGRPLVIKRILPHLRSDDAFVEMFYREARVAAGINHQNVVQTYGLGACGGVPYIAMEYVQGRSLSQLFGDSDGGPAPISLEVALQVVMQACAGAHAAHRLRDETGRPHAIVHRDISPANLMVNSDGVVKLLDFGIAKHSGSERTETGVMKGKLAYMSPEQLRQEPLDTRTDVFALGLVAFELLSGVRKYTARHEAGLISAILTDRAQRLRDHRPDLPEELVDAIERATAADPADRFPSAQAFRMSLKDAALSAGLALDPDAVEAWARDTLRGDETPEWNAISTEVLSTPPPSERTTEHLAVSTPRRQRWRVLALAGVALLCSAGAGVAGASLAPLDTPTRRATVYLDQVAELERDERYGEALELLDLAADPGLQHAETNIRIVETRARVQREMLARSLRHAPRRMR